jgi:hypothetical protein
VPADDVHENYGQDHVARDKAKRQPTARRNVGEVVPNTVTFPNISHLVSGPSSLPSSVSCDVRTPPLT